MMPELLQTIEVKLSQAVTLEQTTSKGKEEEKVKPRTGIEALKFLLDFYDSSVWVNPDDERYWTSTTCEAIWDNVPMFFLSVDGISRAMKKLMSG